jgi:tRNA-dihydrouridine synthase
MKSLTGCDGILLSRGILHNPGLIQDIKASWGKFSDLGEEYTPHMNPMDTEKLEQMRLNDPDLVENTKKKPNPPSSEEVKFSKNLVKIIERRNENCPKIYNIKSLCKEYVEICIEKGNALGNTKYCLNYILKTHKDQQELFDTINSSKSIDAIAEIFDLSQNLKSIREKVPRYDEIVRGEYYKSLFPGISKRVKLEE